MKFKFFGNPLDPFKSDLFKKTALISFFAWIGLGADALSSSCYGPEESYRALGQYPDLTLFVALGTIISIFVIALSYNQVVELFPSGGGGYKVASQLLGPMAGVVSGSALIVDYVLTIAISTASGADAIYSFFPAHFLVTKLPAEFLIIFFFIFLNLRGMKESIKVVMPLFLGFVVTTIALIGYGIVTHEQSMGFIVHRSFRQAHELGGHIGTLLMLAFILHAYSLGSGTYTGIEAVSNNVNKLVEPRVKTGKMTMLYMAISLAVVAGGITLLYMLYHVHPVHGKTLNAVVFGEILGSSRAGHIGLVITLLFEGGILFVAANTGFLAGPTVLANMAADNWLPRRFQLLSSRLVNSQGIIFYGIAALIILALSHGDVSWLVVLYSINVFITFSLTTLGMFSYWVTNFTNTRHWWGKCAMSLLGFIVTSSILCVVLISKFFEGGFVTIIVTCLVIAFCYFVRRHYRWVGRELRLRSRELIPPLSDVFHPEIAIQPSDKTAIIFLRDKVLGMHCLLWILKHFPSYFKNFVFISVGQVDIKSFSGKRSLKRMTKEVDEMLDYFVNYCHQKNLAATSYAEYGSDLIEQAMELCESTGKKYPDHMFFASQMSFQKDTWFKRLLHNGIPYVLQRRFHTMGEEILLVPMPLI
ncbi:MAG TPA: APC family permease [Coxiellaceae bacterium]|nr:MAG: amino acid transporter [Gammaproteobacteria bacterium RIFCSPHIGHO2_12_FULL_36_30]HLB56911.1 APC family permease [Coxiellaceae bacterium]